METMDENDGIKTLSMQLVGLSYAGAVTWSNDFADLVNDGDHHLALADLLIALAGLSLEILWSASCTRKTSPI